MGYRAIITICAFVSASVCSSTYARGFYSWTDAQGNVHYSDQVPPTDSQSGHSVIDSGGQVVDRIAPRKSDAQLERERIEQERIADEKSRQRERQIHDMTLLNTFSSVQDIDRIRDQRLSTIDSLIELGDRKSGKLSEKLSAALNRRDGFRANGSNIPKQLDENIEVLREQIAHSQSKIAEYHQKRAEIVETFRKDRERYVELTSPK